MRDKPCEDPRQQRIIKFYQFGQINNNYNFIQL